uniref:Uncharacterized protein n=1 Tax=Aegilops tauschii subsp. strangulata TaxID=200361 RepID=A0A453SPH5_AEGTS
KRLRWRCWRTGGMQGARSVKERCTTATAMAMVTRTRRVRPKLVRWLFPSDLLHVFPTFKILELGIVSHSVIIGLSLGVSQSPCTIKPLVAALSFHQFFEGFALGDCISQVN